MVLSAKTRPYTFVLERAVKCSLWHDTLEFHTNMGTPPTHNFISCFCTDPVRWNMALYLKTGYMSRVSFLSVSGWSFHRMLSYSPCSLLKGLAMTHLCKVLHYTTLWRTLQTMLHIISSSVIVLMVNYLHFWINDALLVHLVVADLMHPFIQRCHTSVDQQWCFLPELRLKLMLNCTH